MGIDYDANYGIGYRVEATNEISEYELEYGLHEYLWNKVGEGFEYFEVGNAYCGETEGVFITIKDPFKNGLDLTKSKEKLDAELDRLKLKAISEFNQVGGLYIY